MTKFTQISTATLLAILASTAFTATAEARAAQERCQETGFSIFRTACDQRKLRRRYIRPVYIPNTPTRTRVNFRSRTNDELGLRSANGGGENGTGGAGSGGRGSAGNGNGGAAGGRP